jgi:hypothetical protein
MLGVWKTGEAGRGSAHESGSAPGL